MTTLSLKDILNIPVKIAGVPVEFTVRDITNPNWGQIRKDMLLNVQRLYEMEMDDRVTKVEKQIEAILDNAKCPVCSGRGYLITGDRNEV